MTEDYAIIQPMSAHGAPKVGQRPTSPQSKSDALFLFRMYMMNVFDIDFEVWHARPTDHTH